MADEVRANPTALCGLAGSLTGIAGDLRDGIAAAREKVIVPASAFGNSDKAGSVDDSYVSVVEDAGAAVEDVAGVYEGDIDRIYRVAFAYQEQDNENSDDIAGD